MTDKELVQGIQSGNREALEIIIEKYCNEFSNTQLSKFFKEIEENDAR